MTLGILVRKKENVISYVKKGIIHQAVEMQQAAGSYGAKVEIIELDEAAAFNNIKNKIDIVHDKCYGQTKEEKLLLKDFHCNCKKENIPIFNDYKLLRTVGSKWKMDDFLKTKKEIKKYLIPTFLYNQKNISSLIKSYGNLILKPIWGQEGTGVIELAKKSKDILASYKTSEGEKIEMRSERLKNISEIAFLIKKIWENENYIVQTKINSAKFKGEVFDIRLTLQKINAFEVAGIGARVADKNSFLCNIAAGGEMFDGEYVIGEVFPKKSKEIVRELKLAAIKIGEILEKNIDGIVAEIGFDFMIDKACRIWLLEINSKPSPEIFYKKEMEETRKKMTLWPIIFAKKYYADKK